MKTQSLSQLALSLTKTNLVKKSATKSINHRIVEVLEGKKPMERIMLVNEITILRLLEKYSEDELTKLLTNPTDDFKTEYFKVNRTCKNGVDTSLANGSSNANFSFNPEFNSRFEIIKDGNLISLKSK